MMLCRKVKNLASYLWYVLTLEPFQLGCTIVDFAILVVSICRWQDVVERKSLIVVILTVFANFIWQIYNVYGHFRFLENENPGQELASLLNQGGKGKNFSLIEVDEKLLDKENPFQYTMDPVLGVLTCDAVDQLLSEPSISLVLTNSKHKKTLTYIRQYRESLLKFLNQKWHEVNCKCGFFTNDRKICFASEPYTDNGVLKWRITSGYYYHGYLTNFIFSKYIAGSHFVLYPPMNMGGKMKIRSFSESDYADHIGVSTILCTNDGWALLFYQASNAGYNANYCMPSGSGSLDYADYKRGDSLNDMVIKGAERELMEESSMNKVMRKLKKEGVTFSTSILCFYRDMERGGKPEFCCVTRVNKSCEQMNDFIQANDQELAKGKCEWIRIDKKEEWDKVLTNASLALKMNCKALIKDVQLNTHKS